MDNALKHAKLCREFTITGNGIVNEEARIIEVSFSSEEPVLRRSFFSDPWLEILGHNQEEINFSRLNLAAPVLYNHDRSNSNNRIGVVDKAWLENGRGKALLRLSRRAGVDAIWQDVKDGILRNISVSYSIDDYETTQENKDTPDEIRITRWTPLEISLVDIPADPTVGIGRSGEDELNPTNFNPQQKENIMAKQHQEADIEKIRSEAMEQGRKQALQEMETKLQQTEETERQRRTSIKEAFKQFGDQFRDLMDTCLENQHITIDQARQKLLDEVGKGITPVATNVRISVGESELEKFSMAAEEAIEVRAGLRKNSDASMGMTGYSLTEISRKLLEIRGERTYKLDKLTLVGRAFTHSSSDFGNILANVAHKAVLKGYIEAPEVFEQFTRRGVVSDFKTHDRVGMSEFGDLDQIPESGEYKYGTFSDHKEQIQAATYGKLFSISRKAIINDDLTMFTEIPRKMGAAARRKIGDLVFSVLTGNPVMGDGVALFHSTHKNLAGSGNAISVDSVDSVISGMATQKDSSGKATLNITPAYIVVPFALRGKAKVIMESETDPSQANSRKPNSVRDVAKVIADARLDAVSTTAWYMLSDPNAFDTIEVVYLDGNEQPYLEQQEGWAVDGAEFKVRHDFGVKALEWRTMYKNPGA